MAPRVNCNPIKLAKCHAYFQKSRTAHNLKELEKQLVAASAINGMQVKDYLQALVDENKVRCEKIGSGNWYWSFPSADKIQKQKLLADAQSAHDKADAFVQDLRNKIAEKASRLEEEEEEEEGDMLDNPGESREDLMSVKTETEKELKALHTELAMYSDNDPTELERKKKEVKALYKEADGYTDTIDMMESWVKRELGEEAVMDLRLGLYGDEFDAEEGGLRELAPIL